MRKRSPGFIILFFLSPLMGLSQWLPLEEFATTEAYRQESDSNRLGALRPFLLSDVGRTPTDTITPKDKRNLNYRLLRGHLLEVNEDNFRLAVDPILTIALGHSSKERRLYDNTRGINIQGSAGEKVIFGTAFTENQSAFPLWVDSAIRRNQNVIPGQGMGRAFKSNGFDYAFSNAYLGYVPSRHFNATVGYGKNFIGYGYRSLLLSDNAFQYPYLKLEGRVWKLRYSVLYNQYLNPRYLLGGVYQKKFSTLHFLEADLGKRWQVGLFESVIWQAQDSVLKRGFEWYYLNPILFLRPVEFSLASPDNSVFGATLRYRTKNGFFYGQAVLDDLYIQQSLKQKQQHLNNKYGLQAGYRGFDLFGLKGLSWQAEYNTVRPFTYGHRKVNQNYTHYNQALAHPLGANFHEGTVRASYVHDRWYGSASLLVAKIGEDVDGQLFGNNLWGGEKDVPLFGSRTLDGLKTDLSVVQGRVGWMVNPAWRLGLELQGGLRSRVNERSSHREAWFSLGLRTSLWERYWDF